MRESLSAISHAISGERAFYKVGEISNFHRIQASPGFRAAAQHVKRRLEEDGLNVTIKTYPADGKTWYFTSKMFKEWDCRHAYLHLVSPGKCLADFKTNNISIIQRSYACDFSNQPLEIVLLDKGSDAKNYGEIDLKGKLIFVRQNFQDFMDWAVKERGAVGIITDFIRPVKGARERYDLLDILNYTSFWWKHTQDEPQAFGFVLTPREGDALAQICTQAREQHAQDPSKDAYPKATCYVDSSLYEGQIEVVETLLEGESPEEVLVVAHLCHPRSSANDNASGVAAAMEAVKVLKELIQKGTLKNLKRGVRVIFLPEFTGTYPYLHDLGDKRHNIRLGINLDMVGARQAQGYGPITISGTPHATPTFAVNLAALVMDEVKKNVPGQTKEDSIAMFNTRLTEFEGGSDHFILSDPTINIPTFMLGQWPDLNYHTSGDTIEVIDPFILHKSASICAGFIYTAANLAREDVPLILNKGRQRFVADLANLVNQAVADEWTPSLLYEKFEHYTEHYNACNLSIESFFSGAERRLVAKIVAKENEYLNNLHAATWTRYAEDYAPGFVYQAEPVPEIYQYVPYRKYSAPIVNLVDFALGDDKKMEDYKAHMKDFHAKLQSGHTFDGVVQFYIDGKRSLWEIARQACLESREGNIEYVHHYVQLLVSFGLVGIKSG